LIIVNVDVMMKVRCKVLDLELMMMLDLLVMGDLVKFCVRVCKVEFKNGGMLDLIVKYVKGYFVFVLFLFLVL